MRVRLHYDSNLPFNFLNIIRHLINLRLNFVKITIHALLICQPKRLFPIKTYFSIFPTSTSFVFSSILILLRSSMVIAGWACETCHWVCIDDLMVSCTMVFLTLSQYSFCRISLFDSSSMVISLALNWESTSNTKTYKGKTSYISPKTHHVRPMFRWFSNANHSNRQAWHLWSDE